MKVGIIRCMQTEDYCPGTGCFKAVREHGGAFNGEGEGIEIWASAIAAVVRERNQCCAQEN